MIYIYIYIYICIYMSIVQVRINDGRLEAKLNGGS
jgi:hypothetical protein